MTTARLTLKKAQQKALMCGLTVLYYNPGDKGRYRVFLGHNVDWFDGNSMLTTFTLGEVEAFINGWRECAYTFGHGIKPERGQKS